MGSVCLLAVTVWLLFEWCKILLAEIYTVTIAIATSYIATLDDYDYDQMHAGWSKAFKPDQYI